MMATAATRAKGEVDDVLETRSRERHSVHMETDMAKRPTLAMGDGWWVMAARLQWNRCVLDVPKR